MPSEHFLQIGGITIRVRCSDPRVVVRWSGTVSRFLVDAQPAEVELEVNVLTDVPPRGELLFDSGAVWKCFRDGDGYRIDCETETFGAGPYKVARFDETFTRGTISIAPHILPLELNPLDYPLDEVLVSHLLGRGRGVELHSCGIIDQQGRGHLFAGVSGAGKSTTARLWEGKSAGIVSDDRVIVREQGGALEMYGTPWHGEAALSLAMQVPLAGVYLLVQAPHNELRELSRADAVAKMFRCSFPPVYDAGSVAYTLQMLDRIAELVPVRELHFTRDPGVVSLIV